VPSPSNHLERAKRAFAAGRFDEAARSAEIALERVRGDAILHYILGAARTNLSDPDTGLPHLEQAARLNPDQPDILAALANTLRLLDRPQDALDTCERVLANRPDFDPAIAVKSTTLRTSGRTDDAMSFIAPLHAANPGRAAIACEFADACLALDRTDAGIAALEPIAERARASDPKRRTPVARSVFYKLAALLDRAARYDDAFAVALEANRGRPARALDAPQLIRHWSAQRIESLPAADTEGVTPVLVVGMPRSGTTLAERIIAAHPHAAGVGETQGLPLAARALSERTSAPTQAWMNAQARNYLSLLAASDPNARCVVDKLPGNVTNLGLASRLLPGARVIRCTRDPRDVCLSCFFQDFPEGLAFSTDLASCARQHLATDAVMAHWSTTLDIPTLELRYEQLIAEPERTARELAGFLDLDWDPRVLSFHKHAGHVRTASWNQVTRPLNDRSVGRWKHYEQHLRPALDILRAHGAG